MLFSGSAGLLEGKIEWWVRRRAIQSEALLGKGSRSQVKVTLQEGIIEVWPEGPSGCYMFKESYKVREGKVRWSGVSWWRKAFKSKVANSKRSTQSEMIQAKWGKVTKHDISIGSRLSSGLGVVLGPEKKRKGKQQTWRRERGRLWWRDRECWPSSVSLLASSPRMEVPPTPRQPHF